MLNGSKIHKDDKQKIAALTIFLLELLLVFLGQEEGLVVDGVLHLRQKQGRQMARLSKRWCFRADVSFWAST